MIVAVKDRVVRIVDPVAVRIGRKRFLDLRAAHGERVGVEDVELARLERCDQFVNLFLGARCAGRSERVTATALSAKPFAQLVPNFCPFRTALIA